ncbi:MAG: Hsp20/alpha crystallin family protein [Planctomycetota bacterium]|nr:MAG: Hsp20/alpha crystallin family protein [Planctomycetota bacterium]REJ96205.1 MAG: Hsp20/alpha crystallin family protein [Planctomycetota bacterium]REK29361.1 MAG: Hsp20/alpha crystallin family protein [Planctomycetota bacterium]
MFDKLIPWKKKEGGDLQVRPEDHPIARLRHEFDDLWERFWEDWRRGDVSLFDNSRMFGSIVDLDDADKEYVLRAELPGFEPEDFDIRISGNVLTLRAEHKEEGKEKNGNYHRFGSFYESFTLPEGVLSDKIDARYHSGVLEVHLPKSEECRAKQIEVKSS